jgi:hypothetical protein
MRRDDRAGGELAAVRVAGYIAHAVHRAGLRQVFTVTPVLAPASGWPDGELPARGMTPFLPREEFLENMLIPVVEAG